MEKPEKTTRKQDQRKIINSNSTGMHQEYHTYCASCTVHQRKGQKKKVKRECKSHPWYLTGKISEFFFFVNHAQSS